MSHLVKSRRTVDGRNVIAAPGTMGLRYLEFGLLSLPAGAGETMRGDGREAVLYLLSGHAAVEASGLTHRAVLGPRRDVFTDAPWAVYLPPHTAVHVTAEEERLQMAVIRAPSAARTQASVVTPSDVERRVVGAANWRRTVYNVIDAARGAERLMVGETLNPPGHWSSYPPHKHDTRTAAGELPMEEVYYYLTRPPAGFGVQLLYTAPGALEPLDEVYRVENGDLLVIPRGYHPVVAAAGYELCYVWAMAGEESRYGAWSDDPTHAWVRNREQELLKSGDSGGGS